MNQPADMLLHCRPLSPKGTLLMTIKSLKIGTKLQGLTLLTVAIGSGVSIHEARSPRSIDTTYSAVIETDGNGATPRIVAHDSSTVASPARALSRKLVGAFGGRGALASVASEREEL